MRDIERRAAVALGFLGSTLTAVAPGQVRAQPQAQPQRSAPQRFTERLAEAGVVLSFAADPDAVRRWLPKNWEPLAYTLGPHRGSNLFLTFWERLGRQGPDGGATASAARRFATLVAVASVGARGDRRMGFIPIRAWLPAAAVPTYPYGAARAAEVEREVAERGVSDEPAVVREAWTVRVGDGGGHLRLLLDYRRSAAPPRAPFDLRVVSAPEIRPPVDHVYQLDRLIDVLRSEDTDDPRLTRFWLEATVPELREAIGGGEPQPRAVVAEPLVLRDLPTS
jgi:hypothetical protein